MKAVADWFGGAPFAFEDYCWVPYRDAGGVILRAEGDVLVLNKGPVIARRSPGWVAAQGEGGWGAAPSNARALCRWALTVHEKRTAKAASESPSRAIQAGLAAPGCPIPEIA